MIPRDGFSKNKKPHWPSYARSIKRDAKEIAKSGKADFNPLIEKAEGIEEPYYKAQSLAWIARRMAESGTGDPIGVFNLAVESATKIDENWRRSEIFIILGEEMSKSGLDDYSYLLTAIRGIGDSKHKAKVLKTIEHRMMRAGLNASEIKKQMNKESHFFEHKPRVISKAETPKKRFSKKFKSKITLGLYNTYEGNTFEDAHVRAVARAAPLCYAFDLNLCLFAFPVKNALEIVSIIERRTGVGEGGRYLRMLFEEGRFLIQPSVQKPVLETLGALVASTANPDIKKRTNLKDLSKSRFCVLMGLGGSGLPKKILNTSKHHLELTGRDISLETCTAMGVLAAKLDLNGNG